MGLFDKLKGPIFLKESSSAVQQLEALEKLDGRVVAKDQKQLEQDIKMLNWGIKGEEQIAFELKNSHMPMYVLHDLYYEEDGLGVQIDYLIITRKVSLIVECKNLIGDITINQKGDFIRTMNVGGKIVKEGIYSPVTQNKRHLETIKEMRLKTKTNILSRKLFEKNFYTNYQSVVVLANPKTILKDTYAPKDVKNQVLRADQLVEYIRKLNKSEELASSRDKEMENLAQYFLSKDCENKTDYARKYILKEEMPEEKTVAQIKEENKKGLAVQIAEEKDDKVAEQLTDKNEKQNEALIKVLKAYRLEQSRKEKIKPYFIFNDKQMMALIEKKPRSIEELIQISGFGEVKCNKYGAAIVEILQQY